MPTRAKAASPFIARPLLSLARDQNRPIAARLDALNIPVRAPWGGYTPDANPLLLDWNASADVSGLVPVGDRLVTAPGWVQVDPTSLPLGHLWVTPGGSPAGNEQPVIRIDAFRRLTGASITEDLMEITGRSGPGPNGHLFRVVAARAEVLYTTRTGGDGAMVATIDTLPDSVVIPFGSPANSVVNEPVWVWCSLGDNIMFFPDQTGGTRYGDLIEIFRTSDGAGGAAVYPNNPTNFKARSCEVISDGSGGDRLAFLHTEEAGVRRAQRFRWSVVGQAADLAGVGSGARDLAEFRGEGQRILSIGNSTALYMEDGVAFAQRTLNPTNPFRIQIISKKRGLIGTHAITRVANDVHFGIFNDGWYFLNSRGEWREAGRVELQDVGVYRWKETFYNTLDRDQQSRTYLAYDIFRNEVVISFPNAGSNRNNTVWRYDISGDRVWLDDFDNVNGDNMNAVCFGAVQRQLAASTAWSAMAGTWPAQTRSWLSFAPRFGASAVLHGTEAGFVLLHDTETTTRIGRNNGLAAVQTPWRYASAQRPARSDPRLVYVLDRLWMHYVNTGTMNATLDAITHGLPGDTRSLVQSAIQAMNQGAVGSRQSVFGDFRSPGAHHAFRASGIGPTIIDGFDLQFLAAEADGAKDV